MTTTIDDRRTWLASVPLFQGCDDGTLDTLTAAMAEFSFADGQSIVQQGQVGNGLYIVVDGGARIVQGNDELVRLGSGDFFGELSVLDQQPRTASAFAIGATTCLALASWDLMPILESNAGLTLNLLRGLAARLRHADMQLRH